MAHFNLERARIHLFLRRLFLFSLFQFLFHQHLLLLFGQLGNRNAICMRMPQGAVPGGRTGLA